MFKLNMFVSVISVSGVIFLCWMLGYVNFMVGGSHKENLEENLNVYNVRFI